MIANKQLPNRELEVLDSSTDFFGHIDKGDAIVSFLSSNIESMRQTNMVALYGKWGSGKSTLMKYIGTNLEKGAFKSLYFPAWEYEKDENLPLSLLHFISDETETSAMGVVKDLLKLAASASLSALKSVTIDAGIVKINPKAFIDSAKEDFENEKDKSKSTYNTTKEFKKKFIEAEKEIIQKLSKQKLIIFIDDLDRCEPENVLNLISIIKLFFTYSENIVFVFGCDKDAISKAVKHKYGEIIKSDEYLEKVIDVSFNMPKEISISKLLNYYFPDEIKVGNHSEKVSFILEDFFKSIYFTNPRQLKKILNKFEIIRNFKSQTTLQDSQKELIPDLTINSQSDLLEIIFVLFFIILYEFHPETFFDLYSYDKKTIIYTNALLEGAKEKAANLRMSSGKQRLHQNGNILYHLSYPLNQIIQLVKEKGVNNNAHRYNFILGIFTPALYSNKLDTTENGVSFISQFYDKNNTIGDVIALNFCEYLWRKQNIVLEIQSEYQVINYFRMCQVLL